MKKLILAAAVVMAMATGAVAAEAGSVSLLAQAACIQTTAGQAAA